MSVVKKLTSGLEKKYIIYTVLSPLCVALEVLMESLMPFIMAHIIDNGIARYNIVYVIKAGGILIGASVLSLFAGAYCGRFSSIAAQGFSRNLRHILFKKVQDFSYSNMDKFGTGALVTRLTTDVTNVQNMYQNIIRSLVRSPLMLMSGTVMACVINLKLACIFFVTIPVMACALSVIAAKAYPRFKDMFSKYDLLNVIVQENLIAIRVVKSFVRHKYEKEKFDAIAEQLRDCQVKAEKIVICNIPLMQITVYMCIVATLWIGGNFILKGDMSTGELISFISYITQVLMALMMLSMLFVQVILSKASIGRITEVLDEQIIIKSPCDQNGFDAGEAKVADGSIRFDNVSFSYTGEKQNYVLQNINLNIKSGDTVGIIGSTGSSKTTLVSLISRLYDVTEGSVKVGGIDVRSYNLDVLRKSIGFVLQKSVLFTGTIKDNLLWGNEKASDDEIKAACIASEADEFISSLKDGYNTELGQGGVNLSGGQKQRLCIARALLKKPLILILDDSTSAVDTATDSRIRSSLKTTLSQTTKLIISQRVSSVEDADYIIVLDNGEICGVGTHAELLKTCSIYREVYDSQMNEREDA